MTNREQIWMERKAILKDLFFAVLPGLVLFMVFIGFFVATNRVKAQWDEGIRSRLASVNDLAVGQLKDFAIIQQNRIELDYLPKGVYADRFENDDAAFRQFVEDYVNWDSWYDLVRKLNSANETVGKFPGFWSEIFFKIDGDAEGGYELSHESTFSGSRYHYDGRKIEDGKVKDMWQKAEVEDIHCMGILDDGQYLYMAIVPAHRYLGGNSAYDPDSNRGKSVDQDLCMAIWYSCTSESVITPRRVEWLNVDIVKRVS